MQATSPAAVKECRNNRHNKEARAPVPNMPPSSEEELKPIPRRPYYYDGASSRHSHPTTAQQEDGKEGQDSRRLRLPATASMVGLGCSSFSGFFDNDKDDELPSWLAKTTRTSDVDTVPQHHPLVRQWIATIHYAICQARITLLDTAPWYGHGISEQVVGLALQELFEAGSSNNSSSNSSNITRQNVVLNTKVGRYDASPAAQFDFSHQATIQSVQRSLQRLRTPYIDVLQLHDPEFAPSLDVLLQETIPALLTCRQKGWCRALGLTGYPLHVQRQIFQATLQQFGDEKVWDQALTYGHYNLHDQTLLRQPASLQTQQQQQEEDDDNDDAISFWEFCRQHLCACLAAAPLSMGLFTPHAVVPAWHPASSELVAACRQAADICQQKGGGDQGVNITELALLVALAEPRIPVTILGMKEVSQVQTVQRICQRLQKANFDLLQALTDDERRAWEILSDPVQGPFAAVWKNNQYHWGGVAQVREFWKLVPGQVVQEWQAEES